MKAILGLAFVLSINLMLFLGQVAVNYISAEYGPDGTGPQFFNVDDSILGGYNTGNYTSPDTLDIPESDSSVSPTTGNLFTDLWSTITNWATDSVAGRFVTAMPNFLNAINLAPELAWALSAFWYGLAGFAFITWLRGGQ